MNPLKQIVTNTAIPFVVVLLLSSLVIYSSNIPKFIFTLVPYIFYAVSLLALWVSWRFNRNVFIFIIIPILLTSLGFEYFNAKRATLLFHCVSILFPLHLLLFVSFKERGLFSIWGIIKTSFLLLEIGVVLYSLYYPSVVLSEVLKLKIFALSFYPLNDVSMAVAIFSTFTLGALVLFNRFLVYNASFLLILMSFYLGLYNFKTPYAYEASLLSISLIIFIVLIRESYRLAFYDELTSLPGRRALVEDMAKLGRKYSLAMVDIDFFKKFNDTYGHDTGDEVLKMVASKLEKVSGGGKAYRYGGEEFVLLFPSSDVDTAFVHTDVTREVVAKSGFVVRNKTKDKTIYVNVSAGVAQNSSKDKDPFAVMKRADNALYKAKKAGRNKVIKA